MTTPAGLRTHSFSTAKARLSDVMSEVVHSHVPAVIERHGGKEQMLLLDSEALRPLLDTFGFSTQASASEGEFVLRLPELGLIAGGESFEDAVTELEALALDYAQQLVDRYDFYRHTDRADRLPYALRLLLADHAARREMLFPQARSPE